MYTQEEITLTGSGKKTVIAVMIIACIVLTLTAVFPAAALTSAVDTTNVAVSTYICDFEDNYYAELAGTECTRGSIVPSGDGKALLFTAFSSGNGHYFEIYNRDRGRFAIEKGKAYTVMVSYKAENIPEGEGTTWLNLVRYDGKHDTLVGIKTFKDTLLDGKHDGWVTRSVSFRVNTDDDYKYLAVNVICNTASETPTRVESKCAIIMFDDITVDEYGSDAGVIEFAPLGGSFCKTVVANPGDGITLPTPTKEYYDFDGWYTDRKYGTAFNKNVMPRAASTELYAKWKVASDSVAVKYDAAGGTPCEESVGRPGEKIDLPVSEREGFRFVGWYKDKNFNERFEGKSGFPDESTTLYAKWEVIPRTAGFENGSVYPTANNASFTQRCKITDEQAMHGKYSLKYDFYLGTSTGVTTRAAVLLYDEQGKVITVKDGKTYTVSFSYKLAKAVEYEKQAGYIGTIGMICSDLSNAWNDRKEQQTDKNRDVIVLGKDDEGKWQKGSFKFKASTVSETGNVLSIAVSGLSTVFIDDVCVVETDERAPYKGNMICFNSEGGSYCESIFGKYGDAVTLPEPPVRDGFRFIGWYEDEDCSIPYEETEFTRGFVELHAEWRRIINEEKTETAEDTPDPKTDTEEQVGGTANEKKPHSPAILTVTGIMAIIVASIVIFIVIKHRKRAGK